jgi:hypothetical protein
MDTVTVTPPPATAPRNGYGTTALVLGNVGLLLCWVPVIGPILGALGVLLGIFGLMRANRGEATNRGAATAGIVLGGIATLIGIIVTAATFAVVSHTTHGSHAGGLPIGGDELPRVSAPVANRTDPGSPILGDGTYTVPGQMTPGTWQSAGPSESAVPMCYWARLGDLSGNLSAVKASDLTKGQATVTVAAGDAGFTTSGCSTWFSIG